jgi:DNA-binding response OmpR family regulator
MVLGFVAMVRTLNAQIKQLETQIRTQIRAQAEDHELLARAVAAGLRRRGMLVDVALDDDDALARLGVNRYDVVVLDSDLPSSHGDEICRTLAAERSESRVLMLTAASSVRDRVEGLGLGADDYLPKPFDFTELADSSPSSCLALRSSSRSA